MFRPDIPFSRDDANRFLPWMIALMTGLAALMLSVGLSLDRWIMHHHTSATNRITVQIPYRDGQQDTAKEVTSLLEKTPGLTSIEVLSDTQVRKLVAPWLGSDTDITELPLPTVIDITVKTQSQTTDYEQLQTNLHKINKDISLDTRAEWVKKFLQFSQVTQWLIYILASFILAALAGMMVFAARAAMKLHANAVHLLHALGATDRYIARQFQRNAFWLALRGSLGGTCAAGILYFLLAIYAAHNNAPLLPRFTLSSAHMQVLIALPLACCLLAVLSVRRATLAQLRKLP